MAKASKKTAKKKAASKKDPLKKASSKKSPSKKSSTKNASSKKAASKKGSSKKAASKKGTKRKNKLGVKNSLVNNINAHKKKGDSKPKRKSTISKKSYNKMERNWGKKK